MAVDQELGGAVDVYIVHDVRPAAVAEVAVIGRNLALWVAVGIGVGAAPGAAMDNMGLWVALGAAGGAVLGAVLSWKKSS